MTEFEKMKKEIESLDAAEHLSKEMFDKYLSPMLNDFRDNGLNVDNMLHMLANHFILGNLAVIDAASRCDNVDDREKASATLLRYVVLTIMPCMVPALQEGVENGPK